MFALQGEGETLDWSQEWSDWMTGSDAIASSTWTIEPSATLTGPAFDGTLTTVKVADLEAGLSYQLKNTITTTGGLVGEREITIRCAPQA